MYPTLIYVVLLATMLPLFFNVQLTYCRFSTQYKENGSTMWVVVKTKM